LGCIYCDGHDSDELKSYESIAVERFTNHDARVDFDSRIEYYSKFLEDGDFEYWQPVCYMDLDDPERVRRFKRFLWIATRFPKWHSDIWNKIGIFHARLFMDLGERHRPAGLPFLAPPTHERLLNDLVKCRALVLDDSTLFLSPEMQERLKKIQR